MCTEKKGGGEGTTGSGGGDPTRDRLLQFAVIILWEVPGGGRKGGGGRGGEGGYACFPRPLCIVGISSIMHSWIEWNSAVDFCGVNTLEYAEADMCRLCGCMHRRWCPFAPQVERVHRNGGGLSLSLSFSLWQGVEWIRRRAKNYSYFN